jgi:hypothetical protein
MEKWKYVLQGDLTAAVINQLRNAPEISGFAGGAPTVSSTLDGYVIGNRWISVSLEGGSFKWPVVANARVDFNVFAESRTVAHDMAQVALAVLFREMGQPTSPTYGVRITDVRVETGLTRADDKMSDSARFLFALRITYVPAP